MKSSSYRFVYFLLVVLLILGIVYYIYNYTFNSPWLVSGEVAKMLVKNNKVDVILDVRTDLERKTLGFYPSSVHIQSGDLEKLMVKMYPNKSNFILVYCNSGQRARNATDKLHKMGYNNTVYIASGYKSLTDS